MPPASRAGALFASLLLGCFGSPAAPLDQSPLADLGVATVVDQALPAPPDLTLLADFATCMPSDGGAPWIVPPATLSAAGLFADIGKDQLAADARPFFPAFELWSDGAVKRRFVQLPPCTKIDTSDMDHWQFPVGTRLWKEFTIGGVRNETRVIARIGPGPGDWVFAAYQWRQDMSDADWVPMGVVGAGTMHDIPPEGQCKLCHGFLPERVLGFSAIQLTHFGPGETITTLSNAGLLSTPSPDGYKVPGDATTAAALGYLHANCGNCHNPSGVTFMNPFSLRVLVGDDTAAKTGTYRTAVGVLTDGYKQNGVVYRVARGGNTAASCVAVRMGLRGNIGQMPPVATKKVDPLGMQVVNSWILSLP